MLCQAIYRADRDAVRFAFYPDGDDGPRILGEVSGAALRDRLGAGTSDEALLAACNANYDVISALAVDCFRRRPQGPITLECADFAPSRSHRMAPLAVNLTDRTARSV